MQLKLEEAKWNAKLLLQKLKKPILLSHDWQDRDGRSPWTFLVNQMSRKKKPKQNNHLLEKYQNIILTQKKSYGVRAQTCSLRAVQLMQHWIWLLYFQICSLSKKRLPKLLSQCKRRFKVVYKKQFYGTDSISKIAVLILQDFAIIARRAFIRGTWDEEKILSLTVITCKLVFPLLRLFDLKKNM